METLVIIEHSGNPKSLSIHMMNSQRQIFKIKLCKIRGTLPSTNAMSLNQRS